MALESGDHQLAQAIVDGASITLPNGKSRRRISSMPMRVEASSGELSDELVSYKYSWSQFFCRSPSAYIGQRNYVGLMLLVLHAHFKNC